MKKLFILLAASGLIAGCNPSDQGGTGSDSGSSSGSSPGVSSPSTPSTPSDRSLTNRSTVTNSPGGTQTAPQPPSPGAQSTP